MSATPHFVLTLYVAILDAATERQIRHLRTALAENFQDIRWELNLVEVIEMPEKAVANDIFATPTLVREQPKPVLKVLDGLTNIPEALQVISQISL